MYAKVKQTVFSNNLITSGASVGIAVSGGMDSMALLHVLKKMSEEVGFKIACLHFEHGIRGEESLNDLEFVRSYAEEHNIPFYFEHGNLAGISNQEEAARRARYAFFDKISTLHKLNSVAVAHHMDDQAETVLLNLVRGSGVKGLSGMSVKREPNIIRPLLNVSRSDIEEYVLKNNIPYVVDKTNFCTDYSRNYIRNVIIPELKKLNPSVSTTISRTAQMLFEADTMLESYTDELFLKCASFDGKRAVIDIQKLSAFKKPEIMQVLKKSIYFFASKDIERVHVERAYEIMNCDTGASAMLKNSVCAERSYNNLIIYNKLPAKEWEIPFDFCTKTQLPDGVLLCEKVEKTEAVFNKSRVQYVNGDALKGAVIRTRKNGDKILSFGGGTKKLKDVLINAKIERAEREKMPIIAVENEVLWAIGAALSEKLRVTNETKNILKLSYMEE